MFYSFLQKKNRCKLCAHVVLFSLSRHIHKLRNLLGCSGLISLHTHTLAFSVVSNFAQVLAILISIWMLDYILQRLAVAMALHDKGRAAEKNRNFGLALVFLLEADSEFR